MPSMIHPKIQVNLLFLTNRHLFTRCIQIENYRSQDPIIMLYNYFIIAFRNILKYKVFSFINVIGLTIGITCCILLTLFIHYEFSYERHFNDYQNIYRVTSTIASDQWTSTIPCTAPPMVPTFQREFPEIQTATRVVVPPDVQRHYLRFEDKAFYEDRGYVVDSTFFDVFHILLKRVIKPPPWMEHLPSFYLMILHASFSIKLPHWINS